MKRALFISLLAVAAGCPSPSPEESAVPLSTVVVDESVTPVVTALPSLESESGAPRPTARIVDETGTGADFATHEIVVMTDDTGALERIAARWGGTVVRSIEQRDAELDIPALHVVRVDLALAEPEALADDLADLEESRNDLRVSSEDGLATLAIAAAEARRGHLVAVNWVLQSHRFEDRASNEAATGDAGTGGRYSPNAFDWPHFSRSTGPRIGVAEAWRMLEYAGALDRRVRVAVLDGGFTSGNPDLPPHLALSAVPFGSPHATNDAKCGSNPCPYHGTGVAQVVAAVADDGRGTAGTASPIVDLVTIRVLGDFFSGIGAVSLARQNGARIINMSFGVPVPATLSWSVEPFDLTTGLVRASGALLFASAGNDGRDVDAEQCAWFVCWERVWVTPCENSGVECVGGIDWDSTQKAANSAYGAEEVNLFAPYQVYVGPRPDLPPGDRATSGFGTSYSSPFAAGVAALVWAASPELDAGDVMGIIQRTRTTSSDGRVTSIVDARLAVLEALGSGVPPFLQITAPLPGSEHPYGGAGGVRFRARVDDYEDGPDGVTVTWSSDVDGPIAYGAEAEYSFPTAGPRVVTATAVDRSGRSTSRSVAITTVSVPPAVRIDLPADGAVLWAGFPVRFVGSALDPNELFGGIPCTSYVWTRDGDPSFRMTGCEIVAVAPFPGDVTMALSVTDSSGLTGTVRRTFPMRDPSTARAPIVRIVFPTDYMWLDPATVYDFTAEATDPDGGTVHYSWSMIERDRTIDINSAGAYSTATGQVNPVRPGDHFLPLCGGRSVDVQLTVTDDEGESTTVTVPARVFYPVC